MNKSNLLLLRCVLWASLLLSAAVEAVAQSVTDSVFATQSRPVIFNVNRAAVSKKDSVWLVDTLYPQLQALGEHGLVWGRAAASPEGSHANNRRLAQRRREATNQVLQRMGYDTQHIVYDVVDEDYPMLLFLMKTSADPDFGVVDSLYSHYLDDLPTMKTALKKENHGRLWKRLLRDYFPKLRAVRLMAIDSRDYYKSPFEDTDPYEVPDVSNVPKDLPLSPLPTEAGLPVYDEAAHRIPLLNVHTNLLYDVFYMPRFGFAPMLNIGIEYYPRHGHFTYGAWFLSPYWRKWQQHKFFQIRNYELEARYYFRGTDRADYRGWYVSAAIDANKYAIGLCDRDGWQGEGIGAQATVGYVLPLTADHAWKLHFTAGLGYYQTRYDPYLYGKPDFFGHEEDDKYYYDTNLYRDEFKSRQHRYRWLGPTQVAVTLSYDLLWRRGTNQKAHQGGLGHKGISFRHHDD